MSKSVAMSKKIAVLTGASSGIGLEIARGLLAADHALICPVRSSAARQRVVEMAGAAVDSVTCVDADLSRQADLRHFIAEVGGIASRIDVLMNNAGVHRQSREETVDGVEMVFATNVVAYHALIAGLSERVVDGGRIVNTASTFAGDVDLDDVEFKTRPYDGTQAYRQSKALDRMLTWAWARRLEPRGIRVNAFGPGLVMSGLYRDAKFGVRLFMKTLAFFTGKSPQEGADCGIWLATSPNADQTNGFYEKRNRLPRNFADVDAEERLFELCEAALRG